MLRSGLHSHARSPIRMLAAATAVLALTLSAAACAPEPTDPENAGTEVHGKNPIESGEAEHPDPPEEAFDKNVELPASFPASFPQPAGVTIDDTGEREPGTWFIVYLATDQAAADAAWQSVIDQGGFIVSDSTETPEGGVSATLANQDLAVTAVTMPDTAGSRDGAVLLNYDIVAVAQ